MIAQVYNVFIRYEALIVEINPLAVLPNGGLLAVDAVLEIDDSALSRLRYPMPDPVERIENPRERRGKEIGVTYVELGGDIGLISSGAGLGMASMDIIAKTMKPANFLETGGGITADLLYKCMDLVMMKPGLRGILINVYGGINPIHEGAKGIVRYIREHNVKIPIVAKALGNHQEHSGDIQVGRRSRGDASRHGKGRRAPLGACRAGLTLVCRRRLSAIAGFEGKRRWRARKAARCSDGHIDR